MDGELQIDVLWELDDRNEIKGTIFEDGYQLVTYKLPIGQAMNKRHIINYGGIVRIDITKNNYTLQTIMGVDEHMYHITNPQLKDEIQRILHKYDQEHIDKHMTSNWFGDEPTIIIKFDAALRVIGEHLYVIMRARTEPEHTWLNVKIPIDVKKVYPDLQYSKSDIDAVLDDPNLFIRMGIRDKMVPPNQYKIYSINPEGQFTKPARHDY